MPYIIPEDKCISCGTCEAECPVKAIREGEKCFIIDPSVCNNCAGFFDEARCAASCPNQAPEPDPDHHNHGGSSTK